MKRVELSFVLPAFNEGSTIEGALDSLDRVVKDSRMRYEIVVVDDGSVDSTRLKAIRYANKNGHVRVVGYKKNLGKGYAVKKGFMQTAGDAVVFVDSDLEIDLEQVSSYVEALNQGDIVIASKWHPESVVKIPLIRRILGHGFNVLVRLMTGVKSKDTQTGLKAIRRKAFEDIFQRLAVKRYAFDVELLAVANLYGLKVVEMPVNVRMRELFSLKEVWRMFLDLLGITYRLRVLRWYQRGMKKSLLVREASTKRLHSTYVRS
jgi:glycosyltransferase involved in cell wall biosynthesis